MITRWNTLDYLYNEKKITGFLNAVIMDIEEGEANVNDYLHCLVKATQARLINHIAKETGIERKLLCDMFLEDVTGNNNGEAETLKEKTDSILQAAKAFAAPIVPVRA